MYVVNQMFKIDEEDQDENKDDTISHIGEPQDQ